MPKYRYRARSQDGSPQRGVVEARDLEDARLRLTGRGWTQVQVQEAVLPKVQTASHVPPPPTNKGLIGLLVLLLVLLLAGLALLWFDPYGWELLPR